MAKSRYEAADRLALHNRFNQWTAGLVSVGLVLEAIWQPFGLPTKVDPAVINVLQVGFAVLLVVFSLLLSIENFAVRAERMHNCALELSALTDRIEAHGYQEDPNLEGLYLEISQDYSSILGHYENHSTTDYYKYKLRIWRREKPWDKPSEHTYPNRKNYWWDLIRTYLKYSLQFIPYVAIIVAVGWSIWVSLCLPNLC